MTLENEKRFLLLLSSYVISNNNRGNVTKRNVLDTIADNQWVNLSNDDKQFKNNRKELVWRNDFAFIRKHLAQSGFYNSGVRNDWSITNDGKNELKRLCHEVMHEDSLNKVTDIAKQLAVQTFPLL